MEAINHFLNNLTPGLQNILEVKLEDGVKSVAFGQRALQPEEARAPKRRESPSRKHEFLAAKSLGDYLARYGGPDTVVLRRSDSSIFTFFPASSAHGFQSGCGSGFMETVSKPSFAFSSRTAQMTRFAAFVAQHRRSVTEPDGRELSLQLSQIRAKVSIEIQRGRGQKALNGIAVKTEIAGTIKSDFVEFPESLTLSVPLFVDTDRKKVELDLCLEAASSGDVLVLVTAGSVDEAKVAAFTEMVEQVRAKLGGKGTLTFGRPAHADWKYLRELNETARP